MLSTLGPVQAVALLLGQRWEVFATHQDKTGGWVSCDYEVGILSYNGVNKNGSRSTTADQHLRRREAGPDWSAFILFVC